MASPLDETAPGVDPVRSQPAVAGRAARLLVQLRLAVLASLGALACSAMVTHTFLRLTDFSRVWPVLGNLASVLVCVACLLQWWSWRLAHQEWSGRRDVSLLVLLVPGRVAAVIAGGCALLGPLGFVQVYRQTAASEAAHWWAPAAAVLLVLAAAFGAIHPLDPAGPRGARQLLAVGRRGRRS